MRLDNWNALAVGLAAYMREFRPRVLRGALPIRLPRGTGQLIGAFGNDGYTTEERVKREVSALRRLLGKALLIRPGRLPCDSPGVEIAPDALTAFVDDAVWEAWRLACAVPAQEASEKEMDNVLCPTSVEWPTIRNTEAGVR
jgi:hypothetical protein